MPEITLQKIDDKYQIVVDGNVQPEKLEKSEAVSKAHFMAKQFNGHFKEAQEELQTQGDDSVCPICSKLEGSDEQPPIHPNCRCANENKTVKESSRLSPRDFIGKEWEIVVIQEGVSANNFYYPAEVLERDFQVFEGAVLGVSWEKLGHHDIIGSIRKLRIAKENGKTVIAANAMIDDPVSQQKLLSAYKNGTPYEFSIDAKVRASETIHQGKRVQKVQQIVEPTELTLVSKGAAGGKTLRAVASINKPNVLGDKKMEGNDNSLELRALEAAKKAETALAAIEARVKESEFKLLVSEKIADSKLPKLAQDRLKDSLLSGKILDAKEVDSKIAQERDYLASILPPKVTGCGPIEVGTEKQDRIRAAMDGMFARSDVKLAKESVPRFKSLHQAIEVATNEGKRLDAFQMFNACKGFKDGVVNTRAKEALITSDFGQILGDSITRKMLKDYDMNPKVEVIKKLASDVVPVKDFRSNKRLRMGGYGLMPVVAEGGTYTTLTSPTDEEATYSLTKYGGIESVTLEMVANDDVGALIRIPKKLADGAAETLYQTVLNIMANNSTIYDSTAIFRSGNKTSSAFSASTMATARKTMRQQTPYNDSTKSLGAANLPRFILVPADLEETALVIAGSTVRPQDSSFNATETPNIHQGLEVIVVDYWTDTADCALVADPMKMSTLELGFFNGEESPAIFEQSDPTVGSHFNADKISFKLRHIWGYAWLDFRSVYGFSRA